MKTLFFGKELSAGTELMRVNKTDVYFKQPETEQLLYRYTEEMNFTAGGRPLHSWRYLWSHAYIENPELSRLFV